MRWVGSTLAIAATALLLTVGLPSALAGSAADRLTSSAGADEMPTPRAELQHETATDMLETWKHSDATRAEKALVAAGQALDYHERVLEKRGTEGGADVLDHQRRNVELARELNRLGHPSSGTALGHSLVAAEAVTAWQIAALDLSPAEPVDGPDHASPSQALLALADRHDAEVTADQRERLQRLDGLDADVPEALTDVVDAYIAFETAVETALDDGSATRAVTASEPWRNADGHASLARVYETRLQLVEEVADLEETWEPPTTSTLQCGLTVAPAFSLDPSGCSDTYTEDVVLAIDVGGDDSYYNNAGGAGPCDLDIPPHRTDPRASALVDLGEGVDEYGDPSNPRSCGANGGGSFAYGFLYDGGGGDTYTAIDQGVNGGGSAGYFTSEQLGGGFLLDVGGHDSYAAQDEGTNGGAFAISTGALIDTLGSDTYTAESRGTNGGASQTGLGLLVDSWGTDAYDGYDDGVNGGADEGRGFLYDAVGYETYDALHSGVNGGGFADSSVYEGGGFLFDGSGDDDYVPYGGWNGGINGGAQADGYTENTASGLLVDVAGSDTYAAEDADGAIEGFNGGADGIGHALGTLVDAEGADVYREGASAGLNGGANGPASSGFLFDVAGSDAYRVTQTSPNNGANGGAANGGTGFLVDGSGNDEYNATSCGVDGGGCAGSGPGVGFLLDGAGVDTYDDAYVSCQDCSRVAKEATGAQIDQLPASTSTCPIAPGIQPTEGCFEEGSEIESFGVAPTDTNVSAEGHVDLYEFPFPTGGSVVLPCVTLNGSAGAENPCETAGGSFQERAATLVDEDLAVPTGTKPVDTVGVCRGNLTLTAAGIGLQNVGVVTVC